MYARIAVAALAAGLLIACNSSRTSSAVAPAVAVPVARPGADAGAVDASVGGAIDAGSVGLARDESVSGEVVVARTIHVDRIEALTVYARVINAKHVTHQRGAVPMDMHWRWQCQDSLDAKWIMAHVVYADVIDADEIRAEQIIKRPFDEKKLADPACNRTPNDNIDPF